MLDAMDQADLEAAAAAMGGVEAGGMMAGGIGGTAGGPVGGLMGGISTDVGPVGGVTGAGPMGAVTGGSLAGTTASPTAAASPVAGGMSLAGPTTGPAGPVGPMGGITSAAPSIGSAIGPPSIGSGLGPVTDQFDGSSPIGPPSGQFGDAAGSIVGPPSGLLSGIGAGLSAPYGGWGQDPTLAARGYTGAAASLPASAIQPMAPYAGPARVQSTVGGLPGLSSSNPTAPGLGGIWGPQGVPVRDLTPAPGAYQSLPGARQTSIFNIEDIRPQAGLSANPGPMLDPLGFALGQPASSRLPAAGLGIPNPMARSYDPLSSISRPTQVPSANAATGVANYGGGFGTPGMGAFAPSIAASPAELNRMAQLGLAESASIRTPTGAIDPNALQGVSDVVRNRVLSSQFPNTVAGVIDSSPRQFEPVLSGRINKYGPSSPDWNLSRGLAAAVLSGELPTATDALGRPVGNSLNFANPGIVAARAALGGVTPRTAAEVAAQPTQAAFGTPGGDFHAFGTRGTSDVAFGGPLQQPGANFGNPPASVARSTATPAAAPLASASPRMDIANPIPSPMEATAPGGATRLTGVGMPSTAAPSTSPLTAAPSTTSTAVPAYQPPGVANIAGAAQAIKGTALGDLLASPTLHSALTRAPTGLSAYNTLGADFAPKWAGPAMAAAQRAIPGAVLGGLDTAANAPAVAGRTLQQVAESVPAVQPGGAVSGAPGPTIAGVQPRTASPIQTTDVSPNLIQPAPDTGPFASPAGPRPAFSVAGARPGGRTGGADRIAMANQMPMGLLGGGSGGRTDMSLLDTWGGGKGGDSKGGGDGKGKGDGKGGDGKGGKDKGGGKGRGGDLYGQGKNPFIPIYGGVPGMTDFAYGGLPKSMLENPRAWGLDPAFAREMLKQRKA